MHVKVRASDSLTYDIEINPEAVCSELGKLVSERAGVAVGRIRLIYQGNSTYGSDKNAATRLPFGARAMIRLAAQTQLSTSDIHVASMSERPSTRFSSVSCIEHADKKTSYAKRYLKSNPCEVLLAGAKELALTVQLFQD